LVEFPLIGGAVCACCNSTEVDNLSLGLNGMMPWFCPQWESMAVSRIAVCEAGACPPLGQPDEAGSNGLQMLPVKPDKRYE
jgi:hypothetical protein